MHYGVFGAGLIGCYVGGRLAGAGHRVTLVGRRPWVAEVHTAGDTVCVADADGPPASCPVHAGDDARALVPCDRILVTVKALDTEEAAATLAGVAPGDVPVVSLQNGVRNRGVLAARLGEARVFAGMVAFNVVRDREGCYRRTTSGPVRVEGPPGLAEDLRAAGIDAARSGRMEAVLWGKLLFNLNNALVALTDQPLGAAIRDPDCRAVYRALLLEGLAACRAAGVRTAGFGRLRPSWTPSLLALPTPILARLASAVVRADPRARSSMWEDLRRGRRTEVDLLNGEIVALGERTGVATPVNRAIVDLVHAAGRGEVRLPMGTGELRDRVGAER